MKDKLKDIKEIRSEFENHSVKLETLKFLGKMLVFGGIFHLLIFLNPNTFTLQEILAEATGFILDMFGYSFTVGGFTLYGEKAAYIISQDCIGWKSLAVFSALLISTPDLDSRWRYLALGIIILILANILRVLTTIVMSEAGIISFEVVHTFLWRWAMTILVILIWWLKISENMSLSITGTFK